MQTRRAVLYDIVEICRIYNRVVKERFTTADRTPRAESEIRGWLSPPSTTVVAAEGEKILGFGTLQPDRRWADVKSAELGVYIDQEHRRKGAARLVITELLAAARSGGTRKLLAYAPSENTALRALLKSLQFREAGVLERHVQIESVWRDVVILERLSMASRASLPDIR